MVSWDYMALRERKFILNKFFILRRKEHVITTVWNSMIKDCSTPTSGPRYVQYMKKKLHLRTDHDQV